MHDIVFIYNENVLGRLLVILLFDVHVTVHCDKFLIINHLDALISQIYFGRKLYMFRTVPPFIIRSFSLYIQQWYMSYRFADSKQAVSITCMRYTYCCVYSTRLLMMDRGTVQNM